MQYKSKHVIAALLIGISIGATAGTFYYLGFMKDRADDGLPIVIGDDLYVITRYEPPGDWRPIQMATDLYVTTIYEPVDPAFLYSNTSNMSAGGAENE